MPSAPVIIDIEASGFGSLSYPIEVGAVLHDGRRFSSLIKPFEDWTHWCSKAENIHNIHRELLAERGRPGAEVARNLNDFLGTTQAYTDAWVVDKPWIDKLFYRAGLRPSFQLSPIEGLMDEAQIERWDKVKAEVVAHLQLPRHRASTDALIIQQTYLQSHSNR